MSDDNEKIVINFKPETEDNEPLTKEDDTKPSSNVYVINQQLVNQVDSPMTIRAIKDELNSKVQDVVGNVADRYFMLLSNVRHDYTIIRCGNDNEGRKAAYLAASELFECVYNRGDVYRIEYDQDSNKNCVDIWIKPIDEENAMPELYKFFPCDAFIIEVGEN